MRFYVYTVIVDGIVRYIGKGCGDRLNDHARDVKRGRVRTAFQRQLADAIAAGGRVEAKRVIEELSEWAALKLEASMIAIAPQGQLWNTLTGGAARSRIAKEISARPEVRAARSENAKRWMAQRYADPEMREALDAKRHRGPRKAPLGAEAKARVAAAVAESNRRRAGKRLLLSDEARAAKRALALSNPAFVDSMGRIGRD